MKIAYFARLNLAVPDASTHHVFEFCRQIAKSGHDITLFVPDMGPRPKIEGVSIYFVPVLIQKTWASFFTFYLALFFLFPFYWYQNHPEVVYTRHQQLEWLVVWQKWVLGFLYVAEVNGLAPVELKMNGAFSAYITWVQLMERISFEMADALVCPSPIIRDKISEAYGISPSQFLVVTNGADPSHCRPLNQADCRNRLRLDANASWLLFVGSLKSWHGIERIVEIMPRLIERVPDVKLLIVGDGPKRVLIEQLIQDHQLEHHVKLTGSVAHDQIPLFMNSADLCLAPYFNPVVDETGISPLKIFEYMACARTIVYTPAGGLAEVFGKNEIGLAIAERDPLSWVDPITDLINDPARLERLGQRAHVLLQERFTWEAICKGIASHLEPMVKRK